MSTALDRVIRAAEANASGNSDCLAILGACAELRSEVIALAAELARLRRICNAMPASAADGPGISIEEAQDYV